MATLPDFLTDEARHSAFIDLQLAALHQGSDLDRQKFVPTSRPASRSSSPESELQRPLEFEEEECRDWLILELGEVEQIPLTLSYDVGILEVRDRLIARYGPEREADAMTVVSDLINNKRNATGHGVDDGDIWAPW